MVLFATFKVIGEFAKFDTKDTGVTDTPGVDILISVGAGVTVPVAVAMFIWFIICIDENDDGGLIRFSFCLRLQNHTRITSFSIFKLSASTVISSEVGLGFDKKLFSNDTLIVVSILVLFFRRRDANVSGLNGAPSSPSDVEVF